MAQAGAKAGKTGRYLMWFSYIGTRFAGVQRQVQNLTVQSVIEQVLAVVLRVPSSEIRLGVSSRTDSGVHALMNTCLCNLPHKSQPLLDLEPPYDPERLMHACNFVLNDLGLEVRVTGLRRVSDGFCAKKHVDLRTYLYRLAVLHPEHSVYATSCRELAPLIEHNRSYAINSPFDVQRFKDGASRFLGEHQMDSFMGALSKTASEQEIARPRLRYINHIGIDPGRCLFGPSIEPRGTLFDYYDVTIISRSFVYRQIRKMMAMLVAVAQGKAKPSDVTWMLENPAWENFGKFDLPLAPAHGLYLQEVSYIPLHFDNPDPYRHHAWDRDGREVDDSDEDDEEIEQVIEEIAENKQ